MPKITLIKFHRYISLLIAIKFIEHQKSLLTAR